MPTDSTRDRDIHRAALALEGGTPVRTRPFPPRSVSVAADRDAVVRVFDRAIAEGAAVGYGGSEEASYCAEFSASLGGGYADGVNSGTSAVFIALRALEIEPFSEVIVGAITDPGALMAVTLSNCIPVIADTQPGSYNTGPSEIAACISSRTAAILLPHIAGEPADASAIAAIAAGAGIPLIEDCAQAHGARIQGRAVGTFGTVATFSTMYSKHFNTGGQGGLLFTQDAGLFARIGCHADRGKVGATSTAGPTNVVAAPNMNMDEIHAAIGRVQLRGLAERVEARRRIAVAVASTVEAATDGVVSRPRYLPDAEPSFWFLRLQVHGARLAASKSELVRSIIKEGIPLLDDPRVPHTSPWFLQRRVFGTSGYPWAAPGYGGDRDREFPCPNAHAAIAAHVHIPVSERWTDREIADTGAAFAKVAAAFAQS